MNMLLYREDFDQVRDRLAAWWNGADIGRPALQITVPREEPLEVIPALLPPRGWVTNYSTSDFAYRVNLSARAGADTYYLAEAIPHVAPDLAPNRLALYLGCKGVEMPGTVWCEPCIGAPESARFEFDADNSYWDFTLRLAREQLRLGRGKFLTSFPDLIEGLDTLAAMRGTQELLVDLVERPEWVRSSLQRITKLYFNYYDVLYDMMKDDRGGSHFWAWAPGRMAKLQCDFSAMISAEMFGEFMAPVLDAMSRRFDYCRYHWDGPGAIRHHDHLLAIPGISRLQWTPGAGAEPIMSPKWRPLYHKTIEAGKKMILLGFEGLDKLAAFKKEFGPKFKHFMIGMRARSLSGADEIIRIAAD